MFQLTTQDYDMTLVQVVGIYLALSPLQNSGAVSLHIKDLKILIGNMLDCIQRLLKAVGKGKGAEDVEESQKQLDWIVSCRYQTGTLFC
jgi:hypothetical protein